MGNTLLVCDIQPDYEQYDDSIDGFSTKFTKKFVTYLNRSSHKFGKVLYFFNTNDGGNCDRTDLKLWLYESGLTKSAMSNVLFYEKEYGFLRDAMDFGIEDDKIVKALQLMKKHSVRKSINLPMPVLQTAFKTIQIFWDYPLDIISAETIGKITMVGGLRSYCLKELELCVRALELPYQYNDKFIFGE